MVSDRLKTCNISYMYRWNALFMSTAECVTKDFAFMNFRAKTCISRHHVLHCSAECEPVYSVKMMEFRCIAEGVSESRFRNASPLTLAYDKHIVSCRKPAQWAMCLTDWKGSWRLTYVASGMCVCVRACAMVVCKNGIPFLLLSTCCLMSEWKQQLVHSLVRSLA